MTTTDTAPKPPAKKAPAKKATAPKPPLAPRGPGRPSQADKLRESLTATYMGVGLIATPVVGKAFGLNDEQVAASVQAFAAAAPACADAWVQLAETNPGVRAAIEKMTQTGGWATVLTAHAMLGMAVVGAVKEHAPETPPTLPFDETPDVGPARVAPEGAEG